MRLILWINNQWRELAEIEVKCFLSPRNIERHFLKNKELLIVDIDEDDKDVFERISLLGLVKRVSRIIDSHIGLDSYRIEPHPYSKELIDLAIKELSMLGARNPSPRSGNIIDVLRINNESILAHRIYEQGNEWKQRLPHKMPGLYPATIHPLIARAMVNISGSSRTILDSFVGTGGILIEALLTNRLAAGIDINESMLERCRARLKSIGLNPPVWISDARNISLSEILGKTGWKNIDAIVTEPPFGKNTPNREIKKLFEEFLINAENLTKRLVFSSPHWLDIESILANTSWKIKYGYNQRIHKSLTRRILLVEK